MNRSFGDVVAVREIVAAPLVLRLAVGVEFDFQAACGILDQLAFHVAAQVEVAAMGDAFQLAEFARRQEREGVLDVGGADRIVAQFVLVVLAQLQPFAGQAEVLYQCQSAIAPVFVPLPRRVRVAEELDFHLLELARAEREVPRRDLVAEALAHLGDAERHLHAGAVEHVLEVDEDALGGLGAEEGRVFFGPDRADDRLEHQVEFARLGERAEFLGFRARALGERSETLASDIESPCHLMSSASFARTLNSFCAPLLQSLPLHFRRLVVTKHVLPSRYSAQRPTHLIEAISLLRLAGNRPSCRKTGRSAPRHFHTCGCMMIVQSRPTIS